MPEVKNLFTGGKMNKDLDSRLLPKGEYRDALNFKMANSSGSDVGALENELSNKKLTNINVGVNPICIGMLFDNFDNSIYWWIISDTGSYLVEYNEDTRLTTIILEDTRAAATQVLNLNKFNLITGSNVIIDSDNDVKILCWNDALNPPRCINVDRAKAYGANNFNNADISLVKAPPLNPPTITLSQITDKDNNIEERFLRFAYRYQYLDGEFSAFSAFTETAFLPKIFAFDFSAASNDSMVNTFNSIDISFNTGSNIVKNVDLLFKESGSTLVSLIQSFRKTDEEWADNTTQIHTFSNNKIYTALSSDQLPRLFDAVPLKGKAQELIGNRLVIGNYTTDFNIADCDGVRIPIKYTIDKVNTTIVQNRPSETLKSNRDYEVGIVYLEDAGGRMTTVLTSTTNTIYIPNKDSLTKNQLKVTLISKAPCFATKYRFFLKQTKVDYDTIIPTQFFQDRVQVWINMDGNESSKIKEGDFLFVKADTQEVLTDVAQTRVLEIKDQPRNFLEEDSVTELRQPAGKYFRVRPSGYRLNTEDLTNFVFTGYGRSGSVAIQGEVNVIEKAVYYGTVGTSDDLTSSGTYTGVTDIRYLIKINSLGTAAIKASGTVTAATAVIGNTVTVNGLLYTAVAGVKSDNTEFSIDTGDTATALDLAASITADTRTGTLDDVTATSSVAVVTITSTVAGIGGNSITLTSSGVTLAVSGATLTGGAAEIPDTFKFSNDDGVTFPVISNITGSAQTLEEGVQITFVATLGHAADDEWIVSAKSKNATVGGEPFINTAKRAYAHFKSIPSNGNINIDDRILGGANIKIVYDEFNDETEFVEQTFTSSRNYDNLEEWFFRDNILPELSPISLERIWFRRGTIAGANNREFTQDPTGDMTMIIRSVGRKSSGSDDSPKVNSTLEIVQSVQNVIFETIPLNDDSQFFFEIGRTYNIDSNRNHLGFDTNDTSQTASVDAQLILPVFNAFAWGNAFESYKIKDLFNAKTMKIDSRPSGVIEDYRENTRIASLTYGKPYEQTTNFNGLNEFNLSTANFKDMDDRYESVQKLFSRDTNLIVFQEDKVHNVPFQKDILFDADGNGNIRESSNVLGTERAYAGEYGISENPESFAFYGNMIYFTDTRRGIVCRLGLDGITEISNNGMIDFFRDNFRTLKNTKKLGAYDLFNKQYVLHADDGVIPRLLKIPCDSKIDVLDLESVTEFNLSTTTTPANILFNHVLGSDQITIGVTEDGVLTTSATLTGTGTFVYTRADNNETLLKITITPISVKPSFSLDMPCPAVAPAPAPPIGAVNDTDIVCKGGTTTTTVLTNDTFVNPVTVTIITPPTKGMVFIQANNTISYVHGDADLIADVYTYQIDDGSTTDTANVDITVNSGTEDCDGDIVISDGSDTTSEACNDTSKTVTRFHNGIGIFPVVDDLVFTDAAKTTLFNGNFKWFAIEGSTNVFNIDTNGKVLTVTPCGIGFAMLTVGNSDVLTACIAPDTTRFHNGSSELPIVGDTVFTDIGLTTFFNGANLWYSINDPTFGVIRVNSVGLITDTDGCGV